MWWIQFRRLYPIEFVIMCKTSTWLLRSLLLFVFLPMIFALDATPQEIGIVNANDQPQTGTNATDSSINDTTTSAESTEGSSPSDSMTDAKGNSVALGVDAVGAGKRGEARTSMSGKEKALISLAVIGGSALAIGGGVALGYALKRHAKKKGALRGRPPTSTTGTQTKEKHFTNKTTKAKKEKKHQRNNQAHQHTIGTDMEKSQDQNRRPSKRTHENTYENSNANSQENQMKKSKGVKADMFHEHKSRYVFERPSPGRNIKKHVRIYCHPAPGFPQKIGFFTDVHPQDEKYHREASKSVMRGESGRWKEGDYLVSHVGFIERFTRGVWIPQTTEDGRVVYDQEVFFQPKEYTMDRGDQFRFITRDSLQDHDKDDHQWHGRLVTVSRRSHPDSLSQHSHRSRLIR